MGEVFKARSSLEIAGLARFIVRGEIFGEPQSIKTVHRITDDEVGGLQIPLGDVAVVSVRDRIGDRDHMMRQAEPLLYADRARGVPAR